jgi:hypothetical protein
MSRPICNERTLSTHIRECTLQNIDQYGCKIVKMKLETVYSVLLESDTNGMGYWSMTLEQQPYDVDLGESRSVYGGKCSTGIVQCYSMELRPAGYMTKQCMDRTNEAGTTQETRSLPPQ